MLRVIQHRGGNCRRQYVDEQMGLAVAVASSTPCYENQEPSNWYEDTEYVAALDGHIYNWRDLLGDPNTLSGESEGAAAVALLRDIPSDFPEALDGSFALALWEKPSRRLWLARDALGRKPLYYSVVETGTILFASELKAIIEYRARAPRLSREALSAYITFGNVPAPLTLFEGINKLFPGQALQVNSDGAVTKCHYWHVPPFDPYAHSLDDLAGPIREDLLNTLEKQLRNAKRVGVFLSGGADSTILLGALKLLGVQDRHSFTLSHSNGQQVDNRDDCDWARTVATLHGATHHVIEVDTHPAVSSRVPELLSLFDDPVILENRVAGCDLLTREAAKTGVELCLSGNNQQAFGGIWEWKTLRELLAQDSTRHLTTEELVLEAHLNLFSIKEQCALLGADEEEVGRVAASLLNEYIQGVPARDVFDLVATASLLMRSPEQFIPFEERISVTNGIEICYPYFDPLLLKVANGIPAHFRGRAAESMCLAALRWAFRDVLPDDVANRQKVAYPRDPWTDGKAPLIKEIFLSGESLRRSGAFNPAAVQAILSSSEDRENLPARRQFWTLLFFQVWFDCYISGDGTARLNEAYSIS
ncbi:MAG: hypothetical protein JST85_18345 [Acidobacteria bacterium]|nr:hypothetical protein [Acidobacteriota bacterium]